MSTDSLKRALRVFLKSALALFVPGLLGWLNDLTSWAKGEGATPFPDAHGLAYLGVTAITAGVIALVSLLWDAVENATGVTVLRPALAAAPTTTEDDEKPSTEATALYGDADTPDPELGES